MRKIILLFLAIGAFAFNLRVSAHSVSGDSYMHMGGYNFFNFIGGFLMLVFWILIIVGAVYLVKGYAGGIMKRGEEDNAVEILKERYARGEISKEEFEEKKENILGKREDRKEEK